MSFGRQVRTIRLEIAISIAVITSAMLFSLEPAREFFLESTIERQYEELDKFRQVSAALKNNHPKKRDYEYIQALLNKLEKEDFILRDDARLLRAKFNEKYGRTARAREVLESVLKNSGDNLTKMDAALYLADLYSRNNAYKKAIKIIESNKEINPFYRKNEADIRLLRLYYYVNNLRKSGQYAVHIENLDDEDHPLYHKIITHNWRFYTRDEKTAVLKNLSRLGMYEDYAQFTQYYIQEFQPAGSVVEELSLDLVYNCHKPFVRDYINKLKGKEDYTAISEEMTDLYSLSKMTIRSHSGIVRGSYYYKLLRPLNRKARYNYTKALAYYKNYIKGDVDIEYIKKNLRIVTRNLLAFKQYEEITNVIGMSFDALKLNPKIGQLSDDAAFWNAYASYQLNDYENALFWFEKSLSYLPDGYLSLQAKSFIQNIMDSKGVKYNDYLAQVDKAYNSSPDLSARLYYGRLLYALKDGYEKNKFKEQVTLLMKKVSDSPLFDFDNNILSKLKNSDNYIKFVVYTRNGLIEKAKTMLSSADISDPLLQNILVLNELVKNKDFQAARPYYVNLMDNDFIQENFAFFSRDIQMLLYPTPYDSEINVALSQLKDSQLDKQLIYAIIRSESIYIPNARSRVGARGLMQLMPTTARLTSPVVLNKKNSNLYNPLFNIILGTTFLNQEIKAYGFLTAVASYNGGIRIINLTKQKFYPLNELELLEIVPYQETREYVKKVLSSYYRYQSVYDMANLKIAMLKISRKAG